MTRRMSGMPLLDRLDKSYVCLSKADCVKLMDLLDKFPDPPSVPPLAQMVAIGSSSGPPPTHHRVSSGGWGSIRGIAEKFNVFNKSS